MAKKSTKLYNIQVDFGEYLDKILELAIKRGLRKGDLCDRAGIERKRWGDFAAGRKKLTGYYFIKFISGGLGLTMAEFEKKSGKRFSDEQRRELDVQRFVKAKRELIEKLMTNPEFLEDAELLGGKYKIQK